MAITTDNAGAAGDQMPYYTYPQPGDTITVTPWTTEPTLVQPYTPPAPDTKEAITILEEAEYELKELLKKTPDTISIGPKNDQALVEIALRNVQAALRALLKIG